MKTYRSREVVCAEIKQRALALLEIENLVYAESCTRAYAIRDALCRAISEQPIAPGRRTAMCKADFNRAEKEIRRWILDQRSAA